GGVTFVEPIALVRSRNGASALWRPSWPAAPAARRGALGTQAPTTNRPDDVRRAGTGVGWRTVRATARKQRAPASQQRALPRPVVERIAQPLAEVENRRCAPFEVASTGRELVHGGY